LPEKYFDSARKTAMLICKIALPDSPHEFWALHFDGRNEFRFLFNKYKKKILVAGFCPQNLSSGRKIMALSDSEGCSLS